MVRRIKTHNLFCVFLLLAVVILILGYTTKALAGATLKINVKNVVGSSYSIGNNGIVVLYDKNWNLLFSKQTTDGIAIFSGLETGTFYYYEVYNESPIVEEFWGGAKVRIDSLKNEETFVRSMPYVKEVEVTDSSGNPLNGRCVSPGEEVTFRITIARNKVSYPVDSILNFYLDKDKAGVIDFFKSKRLTLKKNEETVSFNVSPQKEGLYYYKLALKSAVGAEDSFVWTDSWMWVEGLCVEKSSYNLHIKVKGDFKKGKIIVFDEDYNPLGIEKAFSKGEEVIFKNLEKGVYYYEVYVDGGKYWGNKKVELNSDVYDTFTKRTPSIENVFFYDSKGNLLKTGCIVPSETVKLVIEVERNKGEGTVTKVKIDRDKEEPYDFYFKRTEKFLGQQQKLVFYITPEKRGNYFYNVELYDYSGNALVDRRDWQFGFCTEYGKLNLSIEVKNDPNSEYSIGNNGIVELYSESGEKIEELQTQNGKVTFTNLEPGKYSFKVYNDGGNGREFWGSGEVVLKNENKLISFSRKMPYATNIVFMDENGTVVSNNCISLENSISANVKVVNNSDYSQNVQVEFSIENGDRLISSPKLISPHSEEIFTFPVTLQKEGDVYYKLAIKTEVGSGKYEYTDIWAKTKGICVENPNVERNIYLQKGWNLVSVPVVKDVDIESFNKKEIRTVWAWRNGKWQAWCQEEKFREVLEDYGIDLLKRLKPGEGFWVKSKDNLTLEFVGKPYGLEILNFSQGWNLCGIGNRRDVTSLKDAIGSGIFVIWKWNNGDWQVWSPNRDLLLLLQAFGFDKFDFIESGEGFWIWISSLKGG